MAKKKSATETNRGGGKQQTTTKSSSSNQHKPSDTSRKLKKDSCSTTSIIVLIALIVVIAAIGTDFYVHIPTTILSAKETVNVSRWEVACDDPLAVCHFTGCRRVVWDGLVPEKDVTQLREMASRVMNKYAQPSGGPTIIDLHSGAMSYGEQFINMYAKIKDDDIVSLNNDLTLYNKVHEIILNLVEKEFGIENQAGLTKPTFFSRITSKEAATSHDEYWHHHIDKLQYGTFQYTCLLYLNTYGQDFTGGRFAFVDQSYRGEEKLHIVEPKAGRISCFTSGNENPHFVEKVSSGTRFALTIAFTCNDDDFISPPQPWSHNFGT
eukprot:m.122988 g.122988  ORF g.122988 m.122988 type:complete len:323 (-) comp9399_c3_seq1:361-1329(-)